ncbi:AAA family ATPase [Bacillus cereus]
MRIALCGEPRSGKDTVAEILNSSDNFHRIAFGDYMKDAYYKKYPERENAPKDREHMISFSQPLVEIYNRIWIDWAESELTLCEESGAFDNFVITDLRQPHEEQWCRDNGFHIVRVHSSEIVRVESTQQRGTLR